jgi:hypothetical protein
MATINGVNFDDVIKEALTAAEGVLVGHWGEVRDIVENIAKGLVNDVEFVALKKATGEFNEDDARVWLDDQKLVARNRLRSVAIITLKTAEDVWNAMAKVFNTAINKAVGWTIV